MAAWCVVVLNNNFDNDAQKSGAKGFCVSSKLGSKNKERLFLFTFFCLGNYTKSRWYISVSLKFLLFDCQENAW